MADAAPARSPRARRICRMQPFSTPSVTAVSGQAASNRAAFVTTWPACATRAASTAKAFGGSGTNASPRHKLPVPGSSRNGGKLQDRAITSSSGPA
jgi:hypothetical protein